MKKILLNFFVGFLFLRTALSFGIELTDLRLWIVIITLSYCYYMLTYEDTRSDTGN